MLPMDEIEKEINRKIKSQVFVIVSVFAIIAFGLFALSYTPTQGLW